MKPITDDVVFSIMKGLEKREAKKRVLATPKPSLSARLLGPVANRRIISLEVARQAKRTVSGVFCYVARH